MYSYMPINLLSLFFHILKYLTFSVSCLSDNEQSNEHEGGLFTRGICEEFKLVH